MNDINSKLTIPPKDLGIEKIHVNITVKGRSNRYARLLNHHKFNQRTVFFARFDKQNEDDQRLDEIALYNDLSVNQILTQSADDSVNIRSQLEKRHSSRKGKRLVGDVLKLIQWQCTSIKLN